MILVLVVIDIIKEYVIITINIVQASSTSDENDKNNNKRVDVKFTNIFLLRVWLWLKKKTVLDWYCLGWMSLFGVRFGSGARVKMSLKSQTLFRKLSTTIFQGSL